MDGPEQLSLEATAPEPEPVPEPAESAFRGEHP